MVAPHIDKIDQSKLRESVYAALCDAFTRGAFAPGDTVNLRSLADQLGTSMTPVREAVRRLVAEGALVDTQSRTLAVPSFDRTRMLDLKRARLALEGLIVDIAFDRMDAAAIDALEAVLTGPGPDVKGPDLQRNFDFHFTLYRQSGSEVLLPMVRALWLQYGAYLNRIIQQKEAETIPEHVHHEEMIAALRQRDRAGLRAALERDIERSFQLVSSDPVAGEMETAR